MLDSDDGDTKKRDEELRVKTDAQKAEAKQRIENERGVRDKVAIPHCFIFDGTDGVVDARLDRPWSGET